MVKSPETPGYKVVNITPLHDDADHIYLLGPMISAAHLSRRRHESGLNKDRRAPEKLPTSNNFMAGAQAQARHNTTFVMMSS